MLANNLRRGGGLRLLDSVTVTVGNVNGQGWGYVGGYGSLSDYSFTPSNSNITALWRSNAGVMIFGFASPPGSVLPLTSMKVGAETYLFSAASFEDDGYNFNYTWTAATNPFGTTAGATKLVEWY